MKVLLFGGTSEGRELAAFLSEKKTETVVSVATEYGRELIAPSPYLSVRTGRLNEREMEELFPGFDLIIDATHPYAVEVTDNIKRAAEKCGKKLFRLLREDISGAESAYGCIEGIFGSAGEAAAYLTGKKGNIFISTGSKDLEEYTVIPDFRERLTVRVLPAAESEEKVKSLGIKKALYSKGPFSYEENISQFKEYGAEYLVSKISGAAGGFPEKMKAAEDLGIRVLLIRREKEEEGLSLHQLKEVLKL
ncbi:MAG: precorrin-6A reductase [Lachnospiraceae bacterium]|nr:precorrin-6A reductase [Lachnospiraceae bacterium]